MHGHRYGPPADLGRIAWSPTRRTLKLRGEHGCGRLPRTAGGSRGGGRFACGHRGVAKRSGFARQRPGHGPGRVLGARTTSAAARSWVRTRGSRSARPLSAPVRAAMRRPGLVGRGHGCRTGVAVRVAGLARRPLCPRSSETRSSLVRAATMPRGGSRGTRGRGAAYRPDRRAGGGDGGRGRPGGTRPRRAGRAGAPGQLPGTAGTGVWKPRRYHSSGGAASSRM